MDILLGIQPLSVIGLDLSHHPFSAILYILLKRNPCSDINGGIQKWLVYNGTSIYEWMMNRGTPISGNHQMCMAKNSRKISCTT